MSVERDADLGAPDFVLLDFEPIVSIPPFVVSEIQSKLAYADERILEAHVSEDRIQLQVVPQASPQAQAELLEKVQRIVGSMAKGAIKPKIQVLEDHLDREVRYHLDPMQDLLKLGEIHQESEGVFTLGPLLTRLVEYFESQFSALAASFDARPYRFPTLIPARYLERVNYFRAFPHSLTFATHLREDLDVIDRFSQQAACDHGELQPPPDSFASVQNLLSPAVCYHLYFSLADKPLPAGKIAATAVGHCYRYEAINLVSLERLWDFTMREVIFVGSKDYVLENREIARQRMSQVFERIGFAYRVESANDPFFIGEFRKQAAFQSAFQLKFEIRASLPFKSATLAVGSYNYHQDFFGRSLNITLPDGSPAHTGCVAFGLERIAFAFIAQFGPDPAAWPAEVRQALS
jgi:seryl-tRNA synthetase